MLTQRINRQIAAQPQGAVFRHECTQLHTAALPQYDTAIESLPSPYGLHTKLHLIPVRGANKLPMLHRKAFLHIHHLMESICSTLLKETILQSVISDKRFL